MRSRLRRLRASRTCGEEEVGVPVTVTVTVTVSCDAGRVVIDCACGGGRL